MSKIDTKELAKSLNKKFGSSMAFNLMDEDPTTVKEWISTSSTILDSKINPKSDVGGIPIGRVVELAGLEGVGKSFMAGQIGGNAQRQGFTLVYIDTESSVSKDHLITLGIDLDNMIYVRPKSLEQIYESIDFLLSSGTRYFIIWDSYANTPSESEIKTDNYNPTAGVAVSARTNSLAMRKLVIKLSEKDSTLLVVNQLKTNITTNHWEKMQSPYTTPGGKAFDYSYSLRIWLTKSMSKNNTIRDEHENPIGNLVRVTLEKSRFGSTKRKCEFPIIWGDPDQVGVQDEASWFYLFKNAKRFSSGGPKGSKLEIAGEEPLYFKGEEGWVSKLKQDPVFREKILHIMKTEILSTGKDFLPEDGESGA